MKIKKFFKTNLVLLLSILVGAGVIVGLFATGKIGNSKGDYDVVIVDQEVDTLNYQIGRASTNKLLGSAMDPLISTRINDPHNNKVIDPNLWRDENGTLNPVFTNLYGELDGNGNVRPFHEGGWNEALEYRILDNSTDFLDETFDRDTPPNSTSHRVLDKRFGGANEIWVSNDSSEYRFYIRGSSGNQDDPKNFWSSGNEVVVEDFVFGLFQALIPSNAAYTSYILTDFSTIRGFREFWNWQNENEDTLTPADVERKWNNEHAINVDEGNGWSNVGPTTGIVYSPSEGFIQFRLSPMSPELFFSLFSWGALWPIDEVFFKRNVGELPFFGIDQNSISTNGVMKVRDFDTSYGVSFEKHDKYFADVASINNMLYRFVKEPATQGTLFRNGYATHLESTDESISQMIKSPEIAPYVVPTFSGAETNFLLFNLAETNQRDQAKFYKNPNFRRAIKFAVDRTYGLNLSGYNTTMPSSLASPSRMSSYTNLAGTTNDFTHYANNMEYLLDVNGQNNVQSNLFPLESYEFKTREDSLLLNESDLNNPNNSSEKWYRGSDPETNRVLAQHYFEEFKKDMEQLSISVPDTIYLEFLNRNPITEKYYQGLSESLQNNLPQVKLEKRQATSSNFYTLFENGEFDMIVITWYPDFQDSWSSTGIFNRTEPNTRSVNMSGSWTFWSGSNHVYGNTYGGRDVSSWGDVGLIEMEDSSFDNLIGFNEAKPIFSTDLGNSSTFQEIKDKFYFEGQTSPGSDSIEIEFDPDVTDGTYVKGIDFSDYISLQKNDQLKLLLIAESLYEYFVPAITMANEYRKINPSRMSNYALPSAFGNSIFGVGYDCTRNKEDEPTCSEVTG